MGKVAVVLMICLYFLIGLYTQKKKTLSFERVLEILDLNYLPAGKSISLFFALESIRYWASLESLDC